MVGRVPRPLRARMLGPRRARAERQARWTQQRRYPANWVCEVVDGAGQPFDFGVDITECGIVKFLHAQGADELSPYLCHLDYVVAEARRSPAHPHQDPGLGVRPVRLPLDDSWEDHGHLAARVRRAQLRPTRASGDALATLAT